MPDSFWEKHFGKESTIVKYEKALTILLLFVGVIAAIGVAFVAAYIGASEQAKVASIYDRQKSELEEKNIANMFYTDISNMDYLLISLNKDLPQVSTRLYYEPSCMYYLDSGIYYTYREKISSLDNPIAKNITRFYLDLILAEQLCKTTQVLMENNKSIYYSKFFSSESRFDEYISNRALILNMNMQNCLRDAIELQPILKKQLVDRYNITPSKLMTIYQ